MRIIFLFLLSLFFCFASNSDLFAQKDTAHYEIKRDDAIREIVNKLQLDSKNLENHIDKKNADKFISVNIATISTLGLFPSDLLEIQLSTKTHKYICRLYVDIQSKKPFMIYLESTKGNVFVIDKQKNEDTEKNRDTFFKQIVAFLVYADIAKDIKFDFEPLMLKTLQECEKYKDCEHCWLIRECEK